MRLTQDDYTKALLQLLALGSAWQGETLQKLINAWATEFERFDQRMNHLLDEADPRNANELLSDYERMLDLPNPCMALLSLSQQERGVSAVVNLLRRIAPITQADLIRLASDLGIEITINDIQPAYFGQARFGVTRLYSKLARWFLFIESSEDISLLKCLLASIVLAGKTAIFRSV